MPKSWSRKDERQYDEIKRSAKQRGASTDRAEEIAARTVNKRRRKEGRTGRRTTSGTGKPGKSLDDRTRQELYNLAAERGIEGRSRMNKKQLLSALRRS